MRLLNETELDHVAGGLELCEDGDSICGSPPPVPPGDNGHCGLNKPICVVP